MKRVLVLGFVATSLVGIGVFLSTRADSQIQPKAVVYLQGVSPGGAQTGNTNVSGKSLVGTAVGIGTTSAPYPLTFANSLGDKIDLWGTAGNHYGFGIQGSLLQIHSDSAAADVAFGFGSSASFTETMRVKGNGNVGIGTNAPNGKLHVKGRVYVDNVGFGGTPTIDLAVGDTDTGLTSSGDGSLDVYSNNVNTMNIRSGNVGIGNTSPGARLDVRTPGGIGVYGQTGDGSEGVHGFSSGTDGTGTFGEANTGGNAYGVWGKSTSGYAGVFEGHVTVNTPGGIGLYGATGDGSEGVHGFSSGVDGTGTFGEANNGGNSYGVWGVSSAGYAGVFNGKVAVTGTLSKGGGSFKIDHPLDPENKYLYHSFVESPDMMNIYNGNVTTNASGYATITMPDWFEPLNRDFRYQLTILDDGESQGFVMAKVVQKMRGNQFAIRTSAPNVEVSWMVTGIRQDGFANAHRIPVEEDKPEDERGLYLYPKELGKNENQGIGYQRLLQRSKALRLPNKVQKKRH